MNSATINLHKENIKKLFKDHFNQEATGIIQLPLSGSNRIYFKVFNDTYTALGAYNNDQKENSTFFYFSEIFKRGSMPVPQLLLKGQNGYYLQEFIDGNSLLDVVLKNGYTDEVKNLYKKSIEQLVEFQSKFNEVIDYSMCHHAQEFDETQILSDLLYFKYYFLDVMQVNYNKNALMEELVEMSKEMARIEPKTFMYRDFQSRNIIVDNNNEVHFIDYQGGMKGLPQYDIVSLLWQAKAALPQNWKRELYNHYYDLFKEKTRIQYLNEIEFGKAYLDCVLLRMLQTLGAYGFRGLIEKKPHFIESIYPALNQLKAFLDEHVTYPKYQELSKVLHHLVSDNSIKKFEPKTSKSTEDNQLVVDIYSFSFKKGTAHDTSGNGGGYIFDCRGILNPGRIEEYKSQTGMDKPVQDYLENYTTMPQFLEHIQSILTISLDDYIARGFNHLNISFGCTGGQHRSVYAAEKMYNFIKNKYPNVVVNKCHLEQEENNYTRIPS